MRTEVTRDISKSVLSKSRLHKLHAFMGKIWGQKYLLKLRVKRFRLMEIYYSSKSDSKGEDGGKGTVVCVA